MSHATRSISYGVLLCFVASVIALGTAYVSEYGFGLVPCKLCLIQRIPFIVAIILSVYYFFFHRVWVHKLILLCYLSNAIIAFYHAGLELHWFPDLLGCADPVRASPGMDFEDFKKQFLESLDKHYVSCGVPALVVLGISMSGWNCIYCISILVADFYLRRVYGKQDSKTSPFTRKP